MNLQTMGTQAEYHQRDIRRQVARCRGCSPRHGAGHSGVAGRWPRLRTRVGFTLVEAGLRLLAAGDYQAAARSYARKTT